MFLFKRRHYRRICLVRNISMLTFILIMYSIKLHADPPNNTDTRNDLSIDDIPNYDGPGLIALGVGYFDFAKQENQALDLRAEIRPAFGVGGVRPWIALAATSDESFYAFSGLLIDINLGEHWVLTPSVGAGGYHRGNGKDMGSVLQFRLQGDLAYVFDEGSRLALSVSHLSNARTSNQNSGAEIITLYYMIPFERVFHSSGGQ